MTSSPTQELVDVESALHFLDALDPGARAFNFRSFPDRGSGPARRYDNVELASVGNLLRQCAAQGNSLCVVVNEGGQRAEEIAQVRALFLDIDRGTFQSDDECEAAMRLARDGAVSSLDQATAKWPRPTVVVASGGGGYHLYWMVNDLPTPRFKDTQRALAETFNGDVSCTDLPRVMRLPGSIHQKKQPVKVVMLECDALRRYQANDLVDLTGISTQATNESKAPGTPIHDAPADDPVLAWLEDNERFVKPGGRCNPYSPVDVICPNVASGRVIHSSPDGLSSTVYMPHGLNGKSRAFHCSHRQCASLKLEEFLQHIGYQADCPDENSDDGLACRFVVWLGGRAMFARGQWHVWNGSYWRTDEAAVKSLLKEFAADHFKRTALECSLAATRNDQTAKRRMRSASSLLNEPRQAQVLKSAATMLRVPNDQLDRSSDVLPVPNGAVNLITGELLSADPRQYTTHCAGVEYHPAAKSPKWDSFLNEIFLGRTDVIAYVQRYVGYCLTGHMRDEVMLVGYGQGANGKSVFAEIIRDVFGDYAITADPSLITAARVNPSGATPEIARLAGKRLCLLNESKVGDKLDDGVVKKLVSTEKIVARCLYREPMEFHPSAKLFLRTNHRPQISDASEGMWRRLHLLPFGAHFSEASRDVNLMAKLRSELPGILAWGVRGSVLWFRDGLQPPPSVVEATSTYREDQDPFSPWFMERTERGGFTTTATLLADYASFSGDRRLPNVTQFANRLKEAGAIYHRRSDARGFQLTLKPYRDDSDDLV